MSAPFRPPIPLPAAITVHASRPAMHDFSHANGKLLRLEDVGRTFGKGEVAVTALSDVTLDIRHGELLVMVGPSGSGKSTLLNIVGGLDTPTAGRVWYRERDMSRFSGADLTRYRRDVV
ncbi:MAG: ATP-binding cassette domain-containing protein, partial [Planctomycetota bacterium]